MAIGKISFNWHDASCGPSAIAELLVLQNIIHREKYSTTNCAEGAGSRLWGTVSVIRGSGSQTRGAWSEIRWWDSSQFNPRISWLVPVCHWRCCADEMTINPVPVLLSWDLRSPSQRQWVWLGEKEWLQNYWELIWPTGQLLTHRGQAGPAADTCWTAAATGSGISSPLTTPAVSFLRNRSHLTPAGRIEEN